MNTIKCSSRIYINLINDYLKKNLIRTIALKGKENYAKLFWNIVINIFNTLIHSHYSTIQQIFVLQYGRSIQKMLFHCGDSFIILTFCYCNISSAFFSNKTCTFTRLFLFFLPVYNVSFF